MILGIIVVIVSIIILVTVTWFAGLIIQPYADVVLANDAVQRVGYDTGAETAVEIGLVYIFPLLGLAIFIWFMAMRLRADQYFGAQPPRGGFR